MYDEEQRVHYFKAQCIQFPKYTYNKLGKQGLTVELESDHRHSSDLQEMTSS